MPLQDMEIHPGLLSFRRKKDCRACLQSFKQFGQIIFCKSYEILTGSKNIVFYSAQSFLLMKQMSMNATTAQPRKITVAP